MCISLLIGIETVFIKPNNKWEDSEETPHPIPKISLTVKMVPGPALSNLSNTELNPARTFNYSLQLDWPTVLEVHTPGGQFFNLIAHKLNQNKDL